MIDEVNGVILQAFHWFLDPDDAFHGGMPLWVFLERQADRLRDLGIDAVWIPPPSKGAGGRTDVGYGVFDHFDLGEFFAMNSTATKYGTRAQLQAAINALHGRHDDGAGNLIPDGRSYIRIYVDVVLNQKTGGDLERYPWEAVRVEPDHRGVERWAPGFESGPIGVKGYTHFDHPERQDRYSAFKWRARHFDGVDTAAEIHQDGRVFQDAPDANGHSRYIYRFIYNEQGFEPQVKPGFSAWVSHEKDNFDYLTGADLDYGRHDVREEMKHWGKWLVETTGVDGFRLDAVKHISTEYVREWLGHVRAATGKSLTAFGEYVSGDVSTLHQYLTEVTASGDFPQDVSLLDFPLRFKLADASRQGDGYDLRGWNTGTLMAEQPTRAVTFVENHDFQLGRGVRAHVEEWIKPLAYAFILLRRGGWPVVFFPDFYGSHEQDAQLGQPPGREYLTLLLQLRRQAALGEERFHADRNVAGWVRMGGVPGALGAMAVVINIAGHGVRAVRLDTGRTSRRFRHLATIKHTGRRDQEAFLVVRGRYHLYGDKAEGLWTDGAGWGDFIADSGTVAIWLEEGVTLR
jgi:alpha-amylase